MRSLHLFAGAGGGLLADLILGHTPIAAVENNTYCCSVLRARRDEGWFPGLAVHEIDIREFDPSEYAGRVDIVAGGFPCQDISAAGKGAGITGERSGLWREFARIIGDVRPRYVFVENSPMLTLRGLDVVLADLAALGFDAEWQVVSAAQAGAPHRRERIWILARRNNDFPHAKYKGVGRWKQQQKSIKEEKAVCKYCREFFSKYQCGMSVFLECDCPKCQGYCECDDDIGEAVAHAHRLRQLQPQGRECDQRGWAGDGCWWQSEPDVDRVAHGVAARAHRLKAIGNGQVPLQAALAWRILNDAIHA